MPSIGLSLPITYNSNDGFTMIKNLHHMIRQNLKMLILTNPGERVMEPTYGVGLSRFLFSNYSENIEATIRTRIQEQVEMYLPVIAIQNIFFENKMETNTILITLKYVVPGLGIDDLLQLAIQNKEI